MQSSSARSPTRRPKSISNTKTNNGSDNKDVVAGDSLYGAVKLKKTSVVSISSSTEKCDHRKPLYQAVQLKKTGTNTRAAAAQLKDNNSSNNKSPKKISTFGTNTNQFDSVKLKKRCTLSDGQSLSRQKSAVEPAYNASGLKSTGKATGVTAKASSLDEPHPAINNGPSAWLSSVLAKINEGDNDDTHPEKLIVTQATSLLQRIQNAGGLPILRRLSVSDNDLVTAMTKVAGNDPSVTEICIDGDVRMHHIKAEVITGLLAEGIRTNLHLKSLILRNCDLGNDFLSTLADSIRTNFMLVHVDLSHNGFTNDSLADFCLSMPDNQSLKTVILTHQHSPIFTLREDLVVEALTANTCVQDFQIEMQTVTCGQAIQDVVLRNRRAPGQIQDYSAKLLHYLEQEAAMAEKRQAERKEEVKQRNVQEADMPYLYELSERARKYKLPYDSELDTEKNLKHVIGATTTTKISLAKLNSNLLTADGAFLTNDFISKHLHKSDTDGRVTFDFTNQIKVFQRFSITDPARALIVTKFVDALATHPAAKDITHILMANSMIGNDWVECLTERCLADSSLFPSLHFLNLETNFIDGPGVTAIARCIANPDTWKYLQAVKLDNQKRLISSDAEDELARSLCVNRSVIKLSLRVRNLLERRKINDYITRNVDFLRQARHWHAVQTGTLKVRARNKVEELFDRVSANDPAIVAVELIADQVFLTLHPDEVIKAARSFKANTHVKKIKMSGLRLDDKFATELAKAIKGTETIESIDLETNMIGSEGVMALIDCLSSSNAVTELQLRHQNKCVSSTDEEKIDDLLANNSVILKLGLDLRSTIARHTLDRKLRQNQELKRKTVTPKKPTTGHSIRNRIQKLFLDIAANDPKITDVLVVCDQVFLSMNPVEILKTAESFATNRHVKTLKMSGLRLDDAWAAAFAESMSMNSSIEKIDLESNSIGSSGMIAIIASLAKNSTITDLLLRHQSKSMGSADEEKVPALIAENDKILKLSMDIRSVGAKSIIDKKLRQNQEWRRRNRSKEVK